MPKKTNSQFDWENDPIDWWGFRGQLIFKIQFHIGWVVGGKNYLEATIFPIDDPTWFRGMIQSTTEPIGQPLVMGSGGNACYIYIYVIYIYICYVYIYILSGWWFGTWFFFHSLGNVIIPTDSYFSEGVGIPPTRYMYIYIYTIINYIYTIIIHI